MALSEQISRRFQELANEAVAVPLTQSSIGGDYADTEAFHRWASSAIHLIKAVFGEESPHYRNVSKAYGASVASAEDLATMRGVFLAARTDYDGGYLFTVEASISGEIFADFVVAAKVALSEGQKDVAAVLACAALEDALKRFASLHGLNVAGKAMQEVVNSLKSKGLVSGAQKSLLDAMPKVRDFAMHAEWGKISSQDVGSVIGFVEQFLLGSFR
jgi:hypothetical protein